MKSAKMLKHTSLSLVDIIKHQYTTPTKLSNKSRSKRVTIMTPVDLKIEWYEDTLLNSCFLNFRNLDSLVIFLDCEGITFEEERTVKK